MFDRLIFCDGSGVVEKKRNGERIVERDERRCNNQKTRGDDEALGGCATEWRVVRLGFQILAIDCELMV
jgi:hypothetical protein